MLLELFSHHRGLFKRHIGILGPVNEERRRIVIAHVAYRLERRDLVRLRRWLDEADLDIVAVALDWSDVDEVRDYAERHELNVPVLLADRSVARDWQIYAFPSYYVLDSEHRLVRSDIGYSSQFGLLWRALMVD